MYKSLKNFLITAGLTSKLEAVLAILRYNLTLAILKEFEALAARQPLATPWATVLLPMRKKQSAKLQQLAALEISYIFSFCNLFILITSAPTIAEPSLFVYNFYHILAIELFEDNRKLREGQANQD